MGLAGLIIILIYSGVILLIGWGVIRLFFPRNQPVKTGVAVSLVLTWFLFAGIFFGLEEPLKHLLERIPPPFYQLMGFRQNFGDINIFILTLWLPLPAGILAAFAQWGYSRKAVPESLEHHPKQ
jgi:hypothetical protein